MTRTATSTIDVSARTRLLASLVPGVIVGAVLWLLVSWQVGLLAAWMAASTTYVVGIWATIWPMDAGDTERHANREDAGRTATDVVVVVSAVASLGAVALLLLGDASASPTTKDIHAALCVGSVALAWTTVHTLYATRYARVYYGDSIGGVDFNQKAGPRYRDFAYLAFTLGMTFQVSDTNITSGEMRSNVLRHSLMSYVFGSVILATLINLVAGLSR